MIELPLEALGLLAGYVAITVLAPRALARPRLILRFPSLTIALWLIALALSLGFLWFGTGLIVLEWLDRAIHGESADHWASSVASSILVWLALALWGVIAFRVLAASQAIADERSNQVSELAQLLRDAERLSIDGTSIYVVDAGSTVLAAVPFAKAIVASRDILEILPTTLRDAALEHERAHLRFHHSILVSATQLAVSAAGGVRASQRFTQSIRIAIELTADDAAARRFGARTAADALAVVYPENLEVAERIERLRRRDGS